MDSKKKFTINYQNKPKVILFPILSDKMNYEDIWYVGANQINGVRLYKGGARAKLAVDFWNNLKLQTVYLSKTEVRELLVKNRGLFFKLLYEADGDDERKWMRSVL